jgi:hypothetical protein
VAPGAVPMAIPRIGELPARSGAAAESRQRAACSWCVSVKHASPSLRRPSGRDDPSRAASCTSVSRDTRALLPRSERLSPKSPASGECGALPPDEGSLVRNEAIGLEAYPESAHGMEYDVPAKCADMLDMRDQKRAPTPQTAVRATSMQSATPRPTRLGWAKISDRVGAGMSSPLPFWRDR